MRRAVLAGLCLGVPALVTVGLLRPTFSPAQPAAARPAAAAKAQAAALPVTQVALFSSGVGYFQREGEVEGNARIDLTFPVEDINDLLKSMVLQDLGGGQVSTVSYDSHDPIEKTLRSFAINLTNNPAFGEILNQARGEKVEVILLQTNVTQPATLSGTVIGLETQKVPAGKDGTLEIEFLNLWCADGMRSVKLADVQRVRFLNPVIENELRRALDVLALSHDMQKKAVSLNFTGEGKRPVRVGYVVENPIWKTSYRLVLNKDNKLFLQGWAVVENTSDDDWNNVRMALISGRPISFQMDLYQPLYVPRPRVEPELFASLRPPTYQGGLGGGAGEVATTPSAPPAPGFAAPADATDKLRRAGGAKDRESLALGGRQSALRLGEAALAKKNAEALDLARGVTSAASATEMGDFFQYTIESPVTLQRQKSAMLPIVNQNVEGTKVSIYNQSVHAKFPLLGLKFKNSTGLNLMQGPVTVFEGNNYAGDARIMDLQPKEERLLSYAIDLGTEVEPVQKRDPDRLTAVKIVKGILHHTSRLRESRTFNIKNRSEHERLVVIEHPFRPDFKLVTPEKPTERSRDVYRFEMKVPAGQSASQEVVEERDLVQQVSLTNMDDQSMKLFMNSNVSSPSVKEALAKAIDLKAKLSETQRLLADLNRQYQEISQDQTRLRANLKELPPTAAAYKRYLEKFDQQETEIERLQAEIKKLRGGEDQQRKEYEKFLLALDVS